MAFFVLIFLGLKKSLNLLTIKFLTFITVKTANEHSRSISKLQSPTNAQKLNTEQQNSKLPTNVRYDVYVNFHRDRRSSEVLFNMRDTHLLLSARLEMISY